MTLGSTRPLTGMCARNISLGVKTAGAYGCQPSHHVPIVKISGSLLEPSGPVCGLCYLFLFAYIFHLLSGFRVCVKLKIVPWTKNLWKHRDAAGSPHPTYKI